MASLLKFETDEFLIFWVMGHNFCDTPIMDGGTIPLTAI